MHPFRIGERVFLSIVFSTIEETVIYLEGGEYFCIVTKGRRLDSDELGIHPGTLVPKDKLFPKASDVIPLSGTLATLPLDSGSFLKRFGLQDYSHADPALSLALTTHLATHEVTTLESLRRHPHPNIVKYRGCVVEGALVEGIALERYTHQLSYVADKVDPAMVLRDVGSALEHLHALGIVHNDVNPANVMLPADLSRAVLIDFDSARPEGHVFGRFDKYGTPGFSVSVDNMKIAERKNDLHGLERIRLWLEDPGALAG